MNFIYHNTLKKLALIKLFFEMSIFFIKMFQCQNLKKLQRREKKNGLIKVRRPIKEIANIFVEIP